MMKANKWGILGLQETHESVDGAATLERFNQRVWAFPNPGEGRRTAGTMFLVFKDFLPVGGDRSKIKHEILVEGRAHMLTFKWRGEEEIRIVNLYAPNDPTDAARFYEKLTNKLHRKPDIVLGDFNHMEHSMDRQPDRGPPLNVTRAALQTFRTTLGLVDGWREANQGVHSFTRTSPALDRNGDRSRSRLDRILTSHDMTLRAFKWDHQSSLGLSDHDLAVVEIFDDQAPQIGPGQWRMSLEDMDDPVITAETLECLLKCEERIHWEDPMTVWLETKSKIQNIFENRQRMRGTERGKALRNLKKERSKIKKRKDFLQKPKLQEQAEALDDRIGEIQKAIMDRRAASATARYQVKGEAVNKYWFSIGKALVNESLIRGLFNERGQLSEVAARHHERLQTCPEMSDERKTAIRDIEKLVSMTKLSPNERDILSENPTEDDVEDAIRASQCGKAPGKDGFIYEFYKKWLKLEKTASTDQRIPSIRGILARVWNCPSKRQRGAPEEYVGGLMAFLYKKGDKREAGNYRPITLLNTDYKLETKCLATKLGETLKSVLHEDQAGFVPGRDIMDHIKLAQIVEEYCDTTSLNGCLVALDQEKAYDRIDHEYLWRILDAYGVPRAFTERVQGLYKNAKTRIMVNRTLSRSFDVKRGVRQGDPMSCLLFNLAIEPLAEMLRRSALRGIRIPGQATRLICKLFADDTQLYLSVKDKLSDAMEIANKWCLASTAKFNEGKTEFLPLGSDHHRRTVVSTRSLQGRTTGNETVPTGARIVKDGESLRILGGRVGHKIDQAAVWDPIVTKMEDVADRWSKRNLTMKGRKLVINFMVLSRAQFFLMTNPLPPDIVKRITNLVRDIAWHNKAKKIMRMEELMRPYNEGGFGMPDFEARVIAAQIALVRKWCLPSDTKPLWAEILDKLLIETVLKPNDPRMTSMIYQKWRENRGPNSKLSKELRDLMKTAYKYNVGIDAPKFDKQAKEGAPIWLSRMVELSLKEENSKAIKRLRVVHSVQTLGDLNRITPQATNGCKDHTKCLEAVRKLALSTLPRFNPYMQTPTHRGGLRDNLDHTRNRKEANAKARERGEAICLNPDVTHRGDLANAIRIFGEREEPGRLPATRRTDLEPLRGLITVYTDGSADKNGRADSKCGAGVWSTNPSYRAEIRVPGVPQTNNRGEIAAVVVALSNIPINQEALIHTDSEYVINALYMGKEEYEDMGWLGIRNADLLQKALHLVRMRTVRTYIQKVKAHSGILGNEMADQAAKRALQKEEPDHIDTTVPTQWKVRGARLAALSFHDIYLWVSHLRRGEPKTKAPQIVARVLEAVAEESGESYLPASLWGSIRDEPIRRQISDFLWQALHGRTVCGAFYRHWGGEWEEKAYCVCGSLETLEHILVDCRMAPWKDKTWETALEILGKADATKDIQWERPSYPLILGVGLYTQKNKTRERLYKIVITEAAFTIWKLRNSRVIHGERVTPMRAAATLNDALFRRAKIDLHKTKLPEFRSPTGLHKARRIKATWKGLPGQAPLDTF